MRTIYLSKGRKARVLILQNAMDNHLGVPLSIQGIKRHWSAITAALAYEAAHYGHKETP
jgi:hypothetical protein